MGHMTNTFHKTLGLLHNIARNLPHNILVILALLRGMKLKNELMNSPEKLIRINMLYS